MKNRISINEKRLDDAIKCVKELDKALELLKENKKNIDLLNKYYGSKEWFKDKDDYERGKICNIKVGVLSEDSVWNLNEDINDIIDKMKLVIKLYS